MNGFSTFSAATVIWSAPVLSVSHGITLRMCDLARCSPAVVRRGVGDARASRVAVKDRHHRGMASAIDDRRVLVLVSTGYLGKMLSRTERSQGTAP